MRGPGYFLQFYSVMRSHPRLGVQNSKAEGRTELHQLYHPEGILD